MNSFTKPSLFNRFLYRMQLISTEQLIKRTFRQHQLRSNKYG